MSTRLDEVLAAITARWAVDVPAAVPGAVVFDGPQPTSRSLRLWVIVGSDGEDAESATADQAESTLSGVGWVDETGTITCSAWAFSGSTDVTERRAEALRLLEACEASLLAHRDLDGAFAPDQIVVRVGPSRVSLTQRQTDGGSMARVVFTVGYSTTITG